MKDIAGYLTKEEVLEFQGLCKEVYGRNLTYEEAEDQATRAVMLMEKLVRFEPLHETYKDTVDLETKN
jgi:hypothetical protein